MESSAFRMTLPFIKRWSSGLRFHTILRHRTPRHFKWVGMWNPSYSSDDQPVLYGLCIMYTVSDTVAQTLEESYQIFVTLIYFYAYPRDSLGAIFVT